MTYPPIPADLMARQSLFGEVREPTSVGRGEQLCALRLPDEYTRAWQLVLNKPVHATGGDSSLLATGEPITPAPLLAYGPVLLAPRVFVDVGRERIVMDYPSRGAVYTIWGANIIATVRGFTTPLAQYSGQLVEGAAERTGLAYQPRLSVNLGTLDGVDGTSTIPCRAVAVSFLMGNEDSISMPAEIHFTNGAGTSVGRTLWGGAGAGGGDPADRSTADFQTPLLIPTDATSMSVVNLSGSAVNQGALAIFHLSF